MPTGIRGPQFGNHSAPSHLPIAFLYATNNTKGSLLEKLIAAKLARFHAFYDTQKFITVVTTACKLGIFFFMVAIPKCLTHIQIYSDVSNTTKLYYVYYCIRATCFDSHRIILFAKDLYS